MPCPSPAPPPGAAPAARHTPLSGTRYRPARGGRAGGKDAEMTASTVIRASLSVPGRPEQVHAARVFTSQTFGSEHPCEPVAVLLVSEVVTNSVLHSDSCLPGGTVTVTVTGT